MRRHLVLLIALLAPALAGAQSRTYAADFEEHRFWVGVGLGYGTIKSDVRSRSVDRKLVSLGIDAGYRIAPEWGLGLEFGAVIPTSGCDGLGCSPSLPGFAPNFTHWFLLGEYRPGNSGMRVRLGAGPSWMCYRYYETNVSTWEKILDAILLGDEQDGSGEPGRSRRCKHLKAFGASASVGYQWRLGGEAPTSLGVRVRGEAANYAASSKAATPAFHHRALMLELQLGLN